MKVLFALFILWGSFAGAAEKCTVPLRQVRFTRAQAIRVIAKEKAYTEGLIFSHGYLYESDGLYGHSVLRKIDPYTGMAQTLRTLDSKYYGEGLAEVNQQLVQLTYREDVAFVYGRGGHNHTIAHGGEGWGLTQLGGELIQSDGSSVLRVLDPETLRVRRKVVVHRGKRTFPLLNELETAHDRIFANILGADWIAMINPSSGCLEGVLDLSALRTPETRELNEAKCSLEVCQDGDFALNGIAFDEAKDEMYFTGKNWPYIFVFKFPK